VRQPGHGPGCSVAKPRRTHSFTVLVNHTRQVPASAAAAGISACVYKPHSEQSSTRVPDERLGVLGVT
jgi:hypothetical protein